MFVYCIRVTFTFLVIVATACGQPTHGRPNFLIIVADDQSPFDLRLYNPESELETPNIDELAARGTVFDAAYHMGSFSGAVCRPSRHMIMTGRTLWHLPKQNGYDSHANDEKIAASCLPAIFNAAGYDTMRTCKKGNSYPAANEQFTVVKDATKRGGTAESGSAWHADRVLEYLDDRSARGDDDPFLIYFGFSHPHDTRDGTPELLAKYGASNHADPATIPAGSARQPKLPVNYLPAHPFHHGHPKLRDEVAVSGVWKRRDERTIRNEIGRQFACSENIDIQIGRVVRKLRSIGEWENTYIMYTADHGMAIGRHGLQGKQNLYEHTWRVPFIFSGPGIQVRRAPGNIYLLDILSTLCDLAGIPIPATAEGKSCKQVLEGDREAIREVLYGAYCGGTKPGIRSLRHGNWKLVKWDVLDGSVRRTQLFDLRHNPNELLGEHGAPDVEELTGIRPTQSQVNLADDAMFADKRQELESLLLEEMKRLDDPYRLWDQSNDSP